MTKEEGNRGFVEKFKDDWILYTLLLAVAAFLLVAFIPKDVSGVIISKEFVPAHAEAYPMPAGEAYVPIAEEVPDTWRVQVLDERTDTKYWVDVTEDIYEELGEGDPFEGQANRITDS